MHLSNKLVVFLLAVGAPAWASSPAEVEYAVIQVLAQEGALYLNYSVDEQGKATVLFGSNEPEWRIKNTVEALQSHPDIAPGLNWSRTNIEFCVIR